MRAITPIAAVASLVLAAAFSPGSGLGAASTPARTPRLPASETTAKSALESSPRHGEFVDVALPSGGTPIRTWVVYPERQDKTGAVLVIHEVFGLSAWIRAVGDQLAAEGFIAVVPDLISGLGPGGGGTDSVASRDDVVKLIRGLDPEWCASGSTPCAATPRRFPRPTARWQPSASAGAVPEASSTRLPIPRPWRRWCSTAWLPTAPRYSR